MSPAGALKLVGSAHHRATVVPTLIVSGGANSSASASCAASLTIPSGYANLWALVIVAVNVAPVQSVSAWAWRNVAMDSTNITNLGGWDSGGAAVGAGWIELWHYRNPAAGAHTFTFTLPTTPETPVSIEVCAAVYANVTSIGTVVAGYCGTGAGPSLTVSSATNHTVLAGFTAGSTLGAITGGTQRYVANYSASDQAGHLGVYDAAGAASVTMSTAASGADWAWFGIDLAGGASSGLTPTQWLSGVGPYNQYAGTTTVTAFETYRNLNCSYVQVYTDQPYTWANTLNVDWQQARARTSQGVLLAPPLWDTAAGAVTDNVNANWATLTGQMQAGDIVRPGWEMNGPNMPWQITASNWSAWQACWIRMYGAVKAANPNVLVCLNLNWGPSQVTGVTNAQILTALNSYCDLFGVDYYWNWLPAGDTQTSWNDRAGATNDGFLDWWVQQCKNYSKKFVIGEWGISSVVDHGTGDETLFFSLMGPWLSANAPYVALECYYNNSGFSGYIWPNTLYPNASAAYVNDIITPYLAGTSTLQVHL